MPQFSAISTASSGTSTTTSPAAMGTEAMTDLPQGKTGLPHWCGGHGAASMSSMTVFEAYLPVVGSTAMWHLGRRTEFLEHQAMKAATLLPGGVSPTGLAQ